MYLFIYLNKLSGICSLDIGCNTPIRQKMAVFTSISLLLTFQAATSCTSLSSIYAPPLPVTHGSVQGLLDKHR